MHHPMFALAYDDYDSIIDDFKPLMAEHGYDIYFNGHEHFQAYGYTHTNDKAVHKVKDIDRGCTPGDEWFPEGGLAEHNKKVEASKGDLIH